MDDDVAPGERTARVFRRRLNELFARGRGGRPVTNREAAQWMTERGYSINEAYLSALRGGHRSSPSLRVVEGIAAFFHVSTGSLVDPEEDPDARLRAALADEGVEQFALRAQGLSPENVRAIIEIVDRVRRLEHLPPVTPPTPDDDRG
ncbi:XRE family transcriptional regulator [Cellulosimicrobium protaetiae]|uniref:XRE family transcriptional regulator n=1 Tax=Cellulosimicrobium protaetiae TaxID=2587808 RepID=A0A6M5UFQ8_9MICO|nr:XRE family transcriptional regulator [Cellulosimicrobium protaetiae]QJW36894.1 XRE family transcriptional regulator [Cellulosimicrobium protaetiae]